MNIVWVTVSVYLVAGGMFAAVFLTKGIMQVDEGASGSTTGFRIIILPGVVAFWPLLLKKWLKASKSKQADNDKTTS